MHSDQWKEPIGNDRAQDTDHDVAGEPKAVALQNLSGNPTRKTGLEAVRRGWQAAPDASKHEQPPAIAEALPAPLVRSAVLEGEELNFAKYVQLWIDFSYGAARRRCTRDPATKVTPNF